MNEQQHFRSTERGHNLDLVRSTRRGLLQSSLLSAAAPAIQVRPAPASPSVPSILYGESHAVVETANGKVRGYSEDGVFTFKGMPYGATTAGAARYQPPQPPTPWTGVRDFLRYGPVCPEPARRWNSWPDHVAFLFEFDYGAADEECLRVNVWTSGIRDNRKRPVMFWLHGGGFFGGSSQELKSYDGKNLARRGDVVVVSINHRHGPFGFLNLTGYGDKYAASANVGMRDILLALEWVRDNIAQFGGDPANVTIFGQSGGGAKVNYLMTMPAARGLFHKAIVQSATPGIDSVVTHEQSTSLGASVVAELGLTRASIDQIQSVPQEQLAMAFIRALQKNSNVGVMPLVDGELIPALPFQPDAPQVSAQVPLMVGHTLNENLTTIGNPASEAMTMEEMRARISKVHGSRAVSVIREFQRLYPSAKPVELSGLVLGTAGYRRQAILQATRKSAQQSGAVYLYLFSWKTPVMDGRLRAFHRSELPFVFDNSDRCSHLTGGGEEARRVADVMSTAWATFARTGDPNHKGLPSWPSFTPETVPTMLFDRQCEVKHNHDREARKLLEQV